MMKIFWSWQSDRGQRVCRHFVREALDRAVATINAELRVEDSDRPDDSEEGPIRVDQDTEGAIGYVDVAKIILDKIDNCTVFVADMTSLGRSETGRLVQNPNVLFELGYAFRAKGVRRIVTVANTAWKFRPEDLPFDVRHRRAPLTYHLPREHSEEAYMAALERLSDELAGILRPMVQEEIDTAHAPGFVPDWQASTTDAARWWIPGDVLFEAPRHWMGQRGGRDPIQMHAQSLIYFRVKPLVTVKMLRETELIKIAAHLPLLMPRDTEGRSFTGNTYGSISYFLKRYNEEKPKLYGATQLFRNSEIWAIDTTATSNNKRDLEISSGTPFLAHEFVEQWASYGMNDILKATFQHTNITLPCELEFGLAPSKGYAMTLGNRNFSEPCHLPEAVAVARLDSDSADDIRNAVIDLFTQFWEKFAVERPEGWNKHLQIR